MKNKVISFISTLVILTTSFAQTKFDVDLVLKSKKGKNSVYLREFADSIINLNQTDEAITILNAVLKMPGVAQNRFELANVYQLLGDCYDDKQEYRKSLNYYNKAFSYILQLKDSALLIMNYTAQAGSYSELGNIDTSLFLLQRAKGIADTDAKKYKRYFKTIYNNLGLNFSNKSNYTEALKNYYRAIDYIDEKGNPYGIASTYNNIGILYGDLKQYDKALENYKKSLKFFKSSNTLGNIAILFEDIDKYDSALIYINEAIKLDKKVGDKAGLSSSYTVVGNLYKKEKEYDSAMYYYTLSNEMAYEVEDIEVVQNNVYNIIEMLMEQKKYAEAKPLAIKNLNSLLEGDELDFICDAYGQLKDICSKLGEYKLAFEYQEKYVIYKDSAQKANKSLEIKNIELNAEYKRKSSNDSLLHAQATLLNNVQHDSEIKKQRLILFGFLVVLLIVAVFSILVFKRYKVSQRQKEIINLQKNEMYNQKMIVEEKQKEILDSIHYAKRIQYALIAHKDFLDEHLPENFVYFNPKDIVSGDFYWATKNEDYFYLAICDSTGHGVPGAFMSLLNIGFLSEAINEKEILEPNKVFDFVRMRLEKSISKEGQKDGFDGILLRYDLKTKKMDYAAANNAPVIISNGVFTELPKDRMPVGVGERKNGFTLFSIDAQSGDKIFFYTDGFADQFGGPEGKKYKYRKLNDLLTNTNLPVTQLSSFLSDEFQAWKGQLEQVDDVCIIGLKI